MRPIPLVFLLVNSLSWQCASTETGVVDASLDAAPDLAEERSVAPADAAPDIAAESEAPDVAEERADVPEDTSLVGAVSCGASMCGDGQVCVVDCVGACGHDSGVPPTITYTCRPWPSQCALRNCLPGACREALQWTADCEAATTCRSGSVYIQGRSVQCTYV